MDSATHRDSVVAIDAMDVILEMHALHVLELGSRRALFAREYYPRIPGLLESGMD